MLRGVNSVTISIVVKEGDEPDAFKAFFPSWDDNYWKVFNIQMNFKTYHL